MELLFKQRFFSWFDSYDIYDKSGAVVFTVNGQLSWGHKLQIYDAFGVNVGTVKEAVFTFLPRFELYEKGNFIGALKKRFALWRHSYQLDFKGWTVEGDFLGWDYAIYGADGKTVATVSKQIFNFTDTYVIDVADPSDALYALMFTLAIDAEKCSSGQ